VARLASYTAILLACHALLPIERLLKQIGHYFAFVNKDHLEITWRRLMSQSQAAFEQASFGAIIIQ